MMAKVLDVKAPRPGIDAPRIGVTASARRSRVSFIARAPQALSRRGSGRTMAVFKVKLRDIEKAPVSLPTDEPHLVVATRNKAYRLEVA
jgi:hypothetical protein